MVSYPVFHFHFSPWTNKSISLNLFFFPEQTLRLWCVSYSPGELIQQLDSQAYSSRRGLGLILCVFSKCPPVIMITHQNLKTVV